jgi:hypothetical protein
LDRHHRAHAEQVRPHGRPNRADGETHQSGDGQDERARATGQGQRVPGQSAAHRAGDIRHRSHIDALYAALVPLV